MKNIPMFPRIQASAFEREGHPGQWVFEILIHVAPVNECEPLIMGLKDGEFFPCKDAALAHVRKIIEEVGPFLCEKMGLPKPTGFMDMKSMMSHEKLEDIQTWETAGENAAAILEKIVNPV